MYVFFTGNSLYCAFVFGRCRGCGAVRCDLQRAALFRVHLRLERHRERRLLRTYIARIKYPLHYHTNATKVPSTTLVWWLKWWRLYTDLKYRLHLTECCRNESSTLPSSTLYTRLYMDLMYYVVSFILPLLLLALFNAKLILAYRQFRKKRRILRPTQLNARLVDSPANIHRD